MKLTFGVVFAAVLAASLLMMPTNSGVVVTADGIRYLSTAENLARGRGFVDYGGTTMSATSPPLYPLVLAGLLGGGVDREQAVITVSWLSLIAIGLFSWLILARLGAGHWAWVGAGAVMASPLVLSASQAALTECFFLAIVLAWCYSLMRCRESWKWLVTVAVLGVAMCLTRHAAVGLMVGAGVALWWQARQETK